MSVRSVIVASTVAMLVLACGGDDGDGPALPVHQAVPDPVVSSAAGEPAADRVYHGICDASAAVMLAGDTLLVAYDELNTLFAYPLSGGRPTARFDLDELLDLPASDEIDIEAAAHTGERIWWIGSHGLDSGANDAPNRRVLFATSVPSPDLQDLQLLVPPQDLTPVLLDSPEVRVMLNKAARRRAPKAGGVNVEGLATTAKGGLLLGFRSPLSAADGMTGKAMIVSLLPDGERFRVQSVSQLDLGDRGVRDLVSDGEGYVLIAGPVNSAAGFTVYGWDGVSAQAEPLFEVTDLHAEALVNTGERWLLLSDDGKQRRADSEADDGLRRCDSIRRRSTAGEHHPSVYFRGRLLPVL